MFSFTQTHQSKSNAGSFFEASYHAYYETNAHKNKRIHPKKSKIHEKNKHRTGRMKHPKWRREKEEWNLSSWLSPSGRTAGLRRRNIAATQVAGTGGGGDHFPRWEQRRRPPHPRGRRVH